MVEVKKLSDTVCIVGLAPSTRDLALNEPPGTEMWCLNQGHATMNPGLVARMTRWFQVHPYEEMEARQRPEFGHLEWLRQAAIPVYMEEAHPDIPMSVRYPYEDVSMDLGGTYLTSAIAFMLALAIYEKFSTIKVYGVDMASGTEYAEQRPCIEYLFGRAIERGINIWLPADCPLLKGPMYAKSVMVSTSHIEKRMQELISAAGYKRDAHREMVGQVKLCRGLLESPQVRGGFLSGAGAELLAQKLQQLTVAEQNLHAEYHAVVGSIWMCEELLHSALKGNGAVEPVEFIQASDGTVHFRGGQDRLYSRPADGAGPLNDSRWWPGNLPPVDISDRAAAIISEHNQRVIAGKDGA